MAAEFTYEPFLLLDTATNQPQANSTGGLLKSPSGQAIPVYDLNGNPLTSLTTGPFGVGSGFRADVGVGLVSFGSLALPATSIEVRDAGPQATAAAASAAAAKAAAEAAQVAAEAAASLALVSSDGAVDAGIARAETAGKLIASPKAVVNALTGWYHVDGFGAVGDGVTDDRAAIQAALDAARAAGRGTVYIPNRVHIVGSFLRIGSGTTLRGAGVNSVIKLKTGSPNTSDSDLLHNYNLNQGFPAKLGTPPAPTVTYVAGGGTLAAATYSYRLSAVNDQGETLASTATALAAPAAGAAMTVSWPAFPGAIFYKVYGRVAGSEQLLAEGITGTSFTDTGALTPRGLVSVVDDTATRATTQDNDITLLDLTLDGNTAGNPLHTNVAAAVYFNHVRGVTVRGVRFRDTTKHAFMGYWLSSFNISGNTFTDCGRADFTALMLYSNNSSGTVSGNTVTGCANGLYADHGTYDVTMAGNTITSCAGTAITVDEGSHDITVSGNTCNKNGLGIAVVDGQTGRRTHSVNVVGNTCNDNTTDGIVFAGADLFSATGNTCLRNGVGIRSVGVVQLAKRGVIAGNVCSLNRAQGIYLNTGTDNVTVESNRCDGNTSHGIHLLSAVRSEVRSNSCKNNNSSNGAGTVSGIRLAGTCVDCAVLLNVCTNDVATVGQNLGIYFSGTTHTGTQYGGNVTLRNKSAQFLDESSAASTRVTF